MSDRIGDSPTLEMSLGRRRAISKGAGNVELEVSNSAALSPFATGSVSAGSAASVTSSSVPHTPPSATANLRSYDDRGCSPYNPYQYSAQPKRHTQPGQERDEDEEDEIVLSYPSNYARTLQTPHSDLQPFSAQRSKVLKINALVPGDSPEATLPALLQGGPSDLPRSLWTLASHEEGTETCVWAIFDTHEHALSALHALRTGSNAQSGVALAEPALESALHPFSKLRKVDMKTWSARCSGLAFAQRLCEHAYPTTRQQQQLEGAKHPFAQHYSPPNSARDHEKEQEQETVTPIPSHTQPHPQGQEEICGDFPILTSTSSTITVHKEQGREREREDHSTPIPPSYAPTEAAPTAVPGGGFPNPSEINSRKIGIDVADGGVLGTRGTDHNGGGVPVRTHYVNPKVQRAAAAAAAAAAGVNQEQEQGREQAPVPKRQFGNGHQEKEQVPEREDLLRLDQDQVPDGRRAARRQQDHQFDESSSVYASSHSFEPSSSPSITFDPPTPFDPSSSSSHLDLASVASRGSSFVADQHPPSTSSVDGAKTMAQSLTAISASVADRDSIANQQWTATSGASTQGSKGSQGTHELKGHDVNPAETSLPYGVDERPEAAVQMRGFSFANPVHTTHPAERDRDLDLDCRNGLNQGSGSRANSNGESNVGYYTAANDGTKSMGRFSPMLNATHLQPHSQQQQRLPWGGERNDEVRRAARFVDFHDPRADEAQPFHVPPPHPVSPQYHTQGHQQDLQKPAFPNDQPHRLPLSFFHQNEQNHRHQNLQDLPHIPLPSFPTNPSGSLGVAPPNAFRHGDWLCNMPGCGAHNFGRNVVCIMCGSGRPTVVGGSSFGLARAQTGSGMSMGMGMAGDAELDNEPYDLDRLYGRNSGMSTMSMGQGHARVPLHLNGGGASNAYSPQAHAHGQASTYIPVTPRYVGLQNDGHERGMRAPPPHMSTPGDLAMNNTLVQALGGISQVAAIQEAIKAHQSQMQLQESKGNAAGGGASLVGGPGQRRGRDAQFSVPVQGGQLLIPTTLGNSPPVPLSQGPIVVQQGRGGRLGVRNGSMSDVQGRNSNATLGLQHANLMYHQGLSPMASQFAPQVQSTQQNYQIQQALVPQSHASIAPSLLRAFSPTAAAAVAAAAIPPSKIPALLTPSGRKFASGGRVQNISRDELNPIVMFWPENEPLPLQSQVRPPAAVLMALGGVQGPPPPILNTGNKGPIDAQPGDWTCGKCDYLNWRRRRVCANCYPHAEGNTEGTKHSTNDVQERVALLASVILQQQQIQSQQATAAAFASAPNESVAATSGFGFGVPGLASQRHQQSYIAPLRRGDSLPPSNTEQMSTDLLAHKYGQAAPLGGLRPDQSLDSPLPFNLPPRMIHPSASDGTISRTFFDSLGHNAPTFQPTRAASQFDRLRSSPPTSSRSSVSLSSNGSFFKNSNEHTPSPLPLLPAFLHEVVGDASESSSSSVHESPSPPSPASASSAFGSIHAGAARVNELVGASLRRRERTSPASGLPQISNNIHRATSQSSIWSLGYPGDRKEEGMRHA